MNQEQIEQAAREHYAKSYSPFADPYVESKEYELECDCFKEGANWALSHQWVSVEDGLPKKTQECFVKCCIGSEQFNYTSMFDTNTQRFDESINDEVTHWMSIPSLEGGAE